MEVQYFGPDVKEKCFDKFTRALEKCPHAIKSDIGGEEFAKELVKGTEVIAAFLKGKDS